METLDAVLAAAFHQHLRAHHVGAHEDAGVGDGAVHMAFSGKVDHDIGVLFLKETVHRLRIGDVRAHKTEARVVHDGREGFQIARVGQLIQIDQQDLRVFLEHIVHKVGTDKTGTAGDQIGFHRSVSLFIYLLLFPDCGRAAARARSSSAQQCFATR